MRVLKLTPEQEVRTCDAYHECQRALNQIKQYMLTGGALAAMKELEAAVQHLEAFRLLAGSRA